MQIETIRTEGLGDSTYVLVHEGQAIVVDPQRDIDRFERALDEAGADLRLVVETHIHNDYVSGGLDLSRKTGAELVMPAGSAPVFRHRPAFHQEPIELDEMTLRPVHTPGHTPEHTSYVVVIEDREELVFSGGSLLVGSAGRTDLLGQERAETLARLQHGSVHRLAALPDDVGLYPTHGAGSFCTTSAAGETTSTIGTERQGNPVLLYDDEDAFVKGQLSDLVPYPSYYRHMAPINLMGIGAASLSVPRIDTIPQDVTIVDARPRERFAGGHLPEALGVELRDSFGTWVGWLTDHNTPLVLILDDDQDSEEAVRQLVRLGYDDIRGITAHPGDGLVSFETADVDRFAEAVSSAARVLDVRAPNEWDEGSIDGSTLTYLPDLNQGTPSELNEHDPVWVVCGSGFRAAIAGGILQDRGFEPVVLIKGGANDVLERVGEHT